MPRKFVLSDLLAELPPEFLQRYECLSDTLVGGELQLRCKKHGLEYGILPGNLRRGQRGCLECANEGRSAKHLAASQVAIDAAFEESRRVHGGKYDYSLANPVRVVDMIPIVCPQHGTFHQTLISHSLGHGCDGCATLVRAAKRVGGAWEKRKALVQAFCDSRGYVVREGLEEPRKHLAPVVVTCQHHGDFKSTLGSLAQGKGCWGCFKEFSAGRRVNSEAKMVFVEKAVALHGDKYDYSKFEYKTSAVKGELICKKHNRTFMVSPNGHLMGKGCPTCGMQMSRAEDEIVAALRKHLGDSAVVTRNKQLIAPYELDIYIPAKRLAIEYDGLYFHSTVNPDHKPRQHLSEKSKLAARKGIRVIHVFESEFETNRELVMRHVLRAAGVADLGVVGARKADVVEVSSLDAAEFFEQNHLQGAVPRGGKVFGLRHEGKLVAALHVAGVKYYGAAIDVGAIELVRYATSCSVPGGLSRLFSAMVAAMSPKTVVSYSDNRWFSGKAYEALGFVKESEGQPSTIVVNKRTKQHVHRSAVVHDKLRGLLGDKYDESLSHDQLAYKAGFFILYDCGQSKWVWTPELKNPLDTKK